jgi:hypothetical protein
MSGTAPSALNVAPPRSSMADIVKDASWRSAPPAPTVGACLRQAQISSRPLRVVSDQKGCSRLQRMLVRS